MIKTYSEVKVEIASISPLERSDSWRAHAIVELKELPELQVVALQVVSGRRPCILDEDKAIRAVSLGNFDDERVLASDRVVTAMGQLWVKLNARISPWAKWILSDFDISASTFFAEATGMAIHNVVETVPLEHSWSFHFGL